MAIRNGTNGRDRLSGTDAADTITGYGGSDTLTGGAGDDVLYGEDPRLDPQAGAGNDRLLGGGGDDFLVGGAGDDRLEGGNGNDIVFSGFGQYGSPYSYSFSTDEDGGNDTLIGGEGIDLAYLQLVRAASIVVDASDPATLADITADGVKVGAIGGFESVDFSFGAGDDVATGTAGHDSFLGREGDDIAHGGGGQDHIFGGAGDDVMDGGDGLDQADYLYVRAGVTVDLRIQGVAQDTRGAGRDTLVGIEQVRGTDFDDRLTGTDGNDTLDGSYGGSDRLDGGAGDDRLYIQPRDAAEPVRSVLTGGDGDDFANIFLEGGGSNAAVFLGGAGSDQLYANGSGQVTAAMGAGADLVVLSYTFLARTLTLGAGTDTISFQAFGDPDANNAAFVTDFTAGPRGDRIDVTGLLAVATGYHEGDDPFATGHLSITPRDGGDPGVLLDFDADGAGGPAERVRMLVLENVRAGALTAFNFAGFDPQPAPASLPIVELPANGWPSHASGPAALP